MSAFLAVALHDVSATSFDDCVRVRAWLGARGVERATLLTIPALDNQPFHQTRPDLAGWLRDRRDHGDAIAQHGFAHRQHHRAGRLADELQAQLLGGRQAEFAGLSEAATRTLVERGHAMLTEAALPPSGFVAPAL